MKLLKDRKFVAISLLALLMTGAAGCELYDRDDYRDGRYRYGRYDRYDDRFDRYRRYDDRYRYSRYDDRYRYSRYDRDRYDWYWGRRDRNRREIERAYDND